RDRRPPRRRARPAVLADGRLGAGPSPAHPPPRLTDERPRRRAATARARGDAARGGSAMSANGARATPATVIVNGTVAADYGVLRTDILIRDGRIAALGDGEQLRREADELIDASGLVVLPGAIDPHAHFEDPGHTEREDFTTGTSSAAAGG